MKSKVSKYRVCPHCGEYISSNYSFYEHKKLCKEFYRPRAGSAGIMIIEVRDKDSEGGDNEK